MCLYLFGTRSSIAVLTKSHPHQLHCYMPGLFLSLVTHSFMKLLGETIALKK